jgi:hypothetical protein
MGLGRLNPGSGCTDDPCNECITCDIWQDDCDVVWECNYSGPVRVVGYLNQPNGFGFFFSNEKSGRTPIPHTDVFYRLEKDNAPLKTIYIDSLGVECCTEGTYEAVCFNAYPNLLGIAVHLSGLTGPWAELNGTYICDTRDPNSSASDWIAVRYATAAGEIIAHHTRGCHPNYVPYEITFGYNTSIECPGVQTWPYPSTIYYRYGIRVRVRNYPPSGGHALGSNCSQRLFIEPLLPGLYVSTGADSGGPWSVACFVGGIVAFTDGVAVGCNDPNGPGIVHVMTGENSWETMPENLIGCGSRQGDCCGGGGLF